MTFYYHYTDYETRIGYLDLKSSPGVYFYVGRNSDYNSTRTVIPYEKERLNIGGGLDLTTGIFTAPTNGRYQFNLVAFANGDRSGVQLRLNGAITSVAFGVSDGDPMPLTAVLNLIKGDQVDTWLFSGAIIDCSICHYTQFTGILLEEDLVL